MIEIPFDLLRRIFAIGAFANGTVKADVPGFSVCDRGGMRPEGWAGASGVQGGMEIVIREKQRVVRLAAIQLCLILQMPAETRENRLDEFFFQTSFISIECHARTFHTPKRKKVRQ